MSRNQLFVPLLLLLLAAGVALADDAPDVRRAGAAEAQAQTDDKAVPVADVADEKARTEKGADRAAGATEAQAQADQGPKLLSGMSILGNQEAPKSLVIVPWKSSELGDSLGISTMLDDSRQPIDKDVFMRSLSYYEVRSEAKP
jgi:hypothetical protein